MTQDTIQLIAFLIFGIGVLAILAKAR